MTGRRTASPSWRWRQADGQQRDERRSGRGVVGGLRGATPSMARARTVPASSSGASRWRRPRSRTAPRRRRAAPQHEPDDRAAPDGAGGLPEILARRPHIADLGGPASCGAVFEVVEDLADPEQPHRDHDEVDAVGELQAVEREPGRTGEAVAPDGGQQQTDSPAISALSLLPLPMVATSSHRATPARRTPAARSPAR